jgi:hypothetical protein
VLDKPFSLFDRLLKRDSETVAHIRANRYFITSAALADGVLTSQIDAKASPI